jgi:hypothetical protein
MLLRLLAALLPSVLLPAAVHAASISVSTLPFTGDPSEAIITFDDATAGTGAIRVTVEVVGAAVGDIRGVYLNLADDSLLAGLSVVGADVTAFQVGGVTGVGPGNNLNGGGSPCPCDIGVEIGTPGIGKDDLRMTVFDLAHTSRPLELALFEGQSVGVRLTSVGEFGERGGSSKLSGSVPEAGTALLLSVGLVGLGIVGRRRR